MTRPIAILYATVSGNAETLAELARERLHAAGQDAAVHNVADFPATRLGEFDTALVIASTWGEGAPPPDAAKFCADLQGDAEWRLPRLRFAVFALGSSTYREFCGCGRQIDEDLARRGANRLLPCVEADVKFKARFTAWLDQLEAGL